MPIFFNSRPSRLVYGAAMGEGLAEMNKGGDLKFQGMAEDEFFQTLFKAPALSAPFFDWGALIEGSSDRECLLPPAWIAPPL